MTITYQPAFGDLLHAARAWEKDNWNLVNKIVAILLFICGISCIYFGLYLWAPVFVALGTVEMFNLFPSSIIRAFLEWSSNPKFKEQYVLTLTPEDLHFERATINSTLKWTHYSRFFETEKAFMLVYGKRMYTIIPKRALSNLQQTDELGTLLSSVLEKG